mmetsp:Transcript_104768/g.303215  ORF Transcript_104768/g.303215 Transcript_104768/m.303215 type:complete len:222 (+) Transcript_104768:96-761(+)
MGECNRTVKALLCASLVVTLVGIILMLVAYMKGSEGIEVDWQATGVRETAFSVDADYHPTCGMAIYVKEVEECAEVVKGIEVDTPGSNWGAVVSLCGSDGGIVTEEYGTLSEVAHVTVSSDGQTVVPGKYTVRSSAADFWAIDWCSEIDEYVGGILAAAGYFYSAVVLFIISCVLCCVSCCCSAQSPSKPQAPAGGGMVIGQPVEGQVAMGRPVAATGPCS